MARMIQIGLKDWNLCQKESKFKTASGEIITKKYVNFPRLGYVAINESNCKLMEDKYNPSVANLKVFLNPKITYTFAMRDYSAKENGGDKYITKKLTGNEIFDFYQKELEKNENDGNKKLFISVKKVDVDSNLRKKEAKQENTQEQDEVEELDELIEESETPKNSL